MVTHAQPASAGTNPHELSKGLFVDGRMVDPGPRALMNITSPRDGATIAQVIEANAEDVDRAVASADAAFRWQEWCAMSVRTRARLVNKLADVMDAHQEELFELETLNNGRPVRETRAQLARVPDLFRYNAGLALARRDDVIPVEGDYLTYARRLPMGVVANVTPFNHPLLIACRNLAPTFASGCTTVVKPSEYTPPTTLRLAEIFSEAGLPPGVFNVVTGPGAVTGRALSEHPGIRKLVLTGGTEAGAPRRGRGRHAALPWGGFKLSGIGREFGREAFDAYFDVKAVMVNVGDQPFDWFNMDAPAPRLN